MVWKTSQEIIKANAIKPEVLLQDLAWCMGIQRTGPDQSSQSNLPEIHFVWTLDP